MMSHVVASLFWFKMRHSCSICQNNWIASEYMETIFHWCIQHIQVVNWYIMEKYYVIRLIISRSNIPENLRNPSLDYLLY